MALTPVSSRSAAAALYLASALSISPASKSALATRTVSAHLAFSAIRSSSALAAG